MTKTQIEALTRRFREEMREIQAPARREAYSWAIVDVADVLERTRKGFDRTRFLKDCGVTP